MHQKAVLRSSLVRMIMAVRTPKVVMYQVLAKNCLNDTRKLTEFVAAINIQNQWKNRASIKKLAKYPVGKAL